MIRPDKAKSFSEGVRICFIVINKLRDLIKKMGHSTSVGDEGGFAPMINDNERALKLIVKAINLSGFKNGKDIEARMNMLTAASMGSTAFQKGLGAIHLNQTVLHPDLLSRLPQSFDFERQPMR